MTPHAFYANLVGVQFRPREVKEIIAGLAPGMAVRLERDPLNSHDKNAIQVHVSIPRFEMADRTTADEEFFIGYLERGEAKKLAPYMDGGTTFEAHIQSATADKNAPWLLEIFPTSVLNKDRPVVSDDKRIVAEEFDE